MKTTLRYLLIVVAMVSVLSVKAQGTTQLPEVQMQSTSVMVSSGSTLPFAAAEGTYVTGSTPGTYSPAGERSVHIRKGLDDDDEDKPKPGQPFPLGDGLWVLMLLAGAYALMRAILINKRKKQQKHCSVR